MRIIKSITDIDILKKAAVISEEILQEIEEHFKHIYNELGEGEQIETFSLEHSGMIVLLEEGDNVEDLAEIGLNPVDNGLLGAIPEWIQEQKLANCTLNIACILCNNEYALSIFYEKGKFGEELEKWTSENI